MSSSAFLGSALFNLNNTNTQISNSVQRLSSGSRFSSASDDIAALSISSRLQSQLVGLRAASTNIAQGDSLLQTAYDGLGEIGDILDRMLSLATQANSGTLTATDRGYLQTEFAELTEEIDRIAGNTSFNDINLLDGTISGQNTITTDTSSATQASASLVFTTIATGNTIAINGSTLIGDTDFVVAGSLEGTIDNLVIALNTSTDTNLSGATYAKLGSNSITITADAGGELGNLFYIDQGTSTATFTTSGTATAGTDIYTLAGGAQDGLYAGSVSASGTIGDALVTAQTQTAASSTISFTGNAIADETITIDDGDGGTATFTFKATASSSSEITIGASIEETIQNAIAKLNEYSGTDDYGVRSLEFAQDGDSLVIHNKQSGNPLDLAAAALNVGSTITNASISATTLNNGTNTGVNTTGVTNDDFIGTISGFSATYNSADDITASITVGGSTYTAEINDTTPSSDTFVRFNSSAGGYFDVEIASGGLAVADQTAANTFATRLDTALSTLTFAQERDVSSFSGTGTLAGGSASFQSTDFTTATPRISNITVEAPTATDATIEFDINGETYSAGDIGSILGAYDEVTLTSTSNSQNKISFTVGAAAVDLSSSEGAATFESALRSSFGLNSTGSGIDFQVGEISTDKLNINISSVLSNQLFAGTTPDISTQLGAAAASTTIQTAINSLGGIIAEVGAAQSRFDYAADHIASSIINIDAARANLADTDIVEESSNYATLAIKNSAAISIIAQANQLRNGLLGLLDAA